MNEFRGYERPDGSVGIRNHVVILPSVFCVNAVAEATARLVPEAVPLLHGHGCARAGKDLDTHLRTLTNLARNPNVAGVLVLGLGCEMMQGETLAQAIAESGKPVELVSVQREGGSRRAAAKGAHLLQGLLAKASTVEPRPFAIDKLIVALNCGGSDAFSGVSANPAVGVVADWVVANGGTVLLTEVNEMIGAAHILQARACDAEMGQRVREVVDNQERQTELLLGTFAKVAISPGNMDGGLSSIREKSLGCIAKGGTTPVTGVVSYGSVPPMKGLVIVDGPGHDGEGLTGQVAAGAQVAIFTTGRGTPIGFPIAPVIKVASNSALFRFMGDDMDFNAGRVLDGEPLPKVGSDLITLLRRVLDGEPTKGEANLPCMYVSLLTTSAPI